MKNKKPLTAKKLLNFLLSLENDGVNLENVNVLYRYDRDSDENNIYQVEEDLYDEEQHLKFKNVTTMDGVEENLYDGQQQNVNYEHAMDEVDEYIKDESISNGGGEDSLNLSEEVKDESISNGDGEDSLNLSEEVKDESISNNDGEDSLNLSKEEKPFWKKMFGIEGGAKINEYSDSDSDSDSESGSEYADNLSENDNEQTFMYDNDYSDDESEVSLIYNAKLKNKKYLNSLNITNLRSIMKNNSIKISKNGSYLRKNEMVKEIYKNFK